MKKILVSGATGFVGSALLRSLQQQNDMEVLGICRTLPAGADMDGSLVAVGDLADAGLSVVLSGVEVVTKLDELPQLWNVLKGEMSLVGPRPNLFNQEDLIVKRDALGVYDVRPGITGLAQVNEIDMSTPQLLAETDAEMIRTLSLANYFKYVFQTVAGKGSGDRVK